MIKNNLFFGYVYMIYNDINNKVYIGETIQKLDKRFKQHMVDSHNLNHRCYNCHFYRAIRKYGIDHFFVRELEMITGTNKNEVKHQIQELEKEYYNAVYSSLGSQCEDMYELGYDIADIVEREKYEKYLGQRADLLGALCEQRGIKLWEKE